MIENDVEGLENSVNWDTQKVPKEIIQVLCDVRSAFWLAQNDKWPLLTDFAFFGNQCYITNMLNGVSFCESTIHKQKGSNNARVSKQVSGWLQVSPRVREKLLEII